MFVSVLLRLSEQHAKAQRGNYMLGVYSVRVCSQMYEQQLAHRSFS